MTKREATASWQGDLKEGEGSVTIGDGSPEGYDFESRFGQGTGTNPEQMLAAAQASCYAMALSNELASNGYTAERIEAQSEVNLAGQDGKPYRIDRVTIDCQVLQEELGESELQKLAKSALEHCPVANLFAGVQIDLRATLKHPMPQADHT